MRQTQSMKLKREDCKLLRELACLRTVSEERLVSPYEVVSDLLATFKKTQEYAHLRRLQRLD